MNNELKYSENKLIEEGIEGHMEERKYTPDKSITEIIEDLNYLYDNSRLTASISRSASLLAEYIYKYFEDATAPVVSYIIDNLEEVGLYSLDYWSKPTRVTSISYALKLAKEKKLSATDDDIKGDHQSICKELAHIIAAMTNAGHYTLTSYGFKSYNPPDRMLDQEMSKLLRYSNMKFFKVHNVKPAYDDLPNNIIEGTWSVTISYYKNPDLKLNIAYFIKDRFAGHNLYRLKYTLEKNGTVLSSATQVLPADAHTHTERLAVCIAYTIATLLEIDEETTADILQFFG
jgi:hypothetical protein